MAIKRTNKEVITRRLASANITDLQRLVDYLAYKEATAPSKATQIDVDTLVDEIKQGWWANNRNRLIK